MFEREGLADKAHVFELALPGEADSVGLALYSQIFVLKVRQPRPTSWYCAARPSASATPRPSHPFLSSPAPLCQGFKMRDENMYALEQGLCAPDYDGGIYTAARWWCRDPAAAKARYGPIACFVGHLRDYRDEHAVHSPS
jgi:hypothetical protein